MSGCPKHLSQKVSKNKLKFHYNIIAKNVLDYVQSLSILFNPPSQSSFKRNAQPVPPPDDKKKDELEMPAIFSNYSLYSIIPVQSTEKYLIKI